MTTATATKPKPTRRGKSTEEIYEAVTNRMIEALEGGTVPWQRPWKLSTAHANLKTKKAYRGINPFLLDFTAQTEGYKRSYWLTYKQADALGGQVRKGEKSTLVIFWKLLTVDKIVNGQKIKDKNGKPVKTKLPLLNYYNVFNVDQVEGIEDKIPAEIEEKEFDPIQEAQSIIDEMPNAPKIMHRGDRACYVPSLDCVHLPDQEQFQSAEYYYHTAYHELVHSTGHEDRLHRVKDWATFGKDPYAKEELVAEMGASMVSAIAGIDVPVQDNSANYLASWLKRFKEDKKLLVQAASKAQRASDFIIGKTYEDDKEASNQPKGTA